MNVILNGNLLLTEEALIGLDNRGFLYGDGLFETIIYVDNKPLYLEDHLERLIGGMTALSIVSPEAFKKETIASAINHLCSVNMLKDIARVKIQVWRKAGGLYTPKNNEPEYFISTAPFIPPSVIPRKVDFAKTVFLQHTLISSFKTCNALPYVLAGIEKEKRSLDDLILLDVNGYISECSASNIFWLSHGVFFTPALHTGCIAGVRRKNIIRRLKSAGFEVREIKAKPEEILSAEQVLSCNVAGIYPIEYIGTKRFFLDDLAFLS